MIRGAGNISTSIAIFGWIFLGLVTAVRSGDGRWTSSNVLFGTNTLVYALRSDINSKFGHKLILQENAMADYKNSRLFNGSRSTRVDTHDEEIQSNEGSRELNAPSIVYPRIVVIVDNGIWAREGSDLTHLLHYLVGVWNGVDLNFREINNTKVRINIAGIMIEEHAGSIPFLSEFKSRGAEVYLGDVAKAFAEFMKTNGSYWSSQFPLYHTAVLMTSLEDLKKRRYRGGDHVSRPICTDINKSGPQGTVVFSDQGAWSGITYELTYYLVHSFAYSETRMQCRSKKFMDVVFSGLVDDYDPELPMWSECSLEIFDKRLNSERANCLREKPNVTSPLPRALPGKILSCDRTCKVMQADSQCCSEEPKDAVCTKLICQRYEWSWSWTPYKPTCFPIKTYAPDGTPCGDGKICFRRRCVAEKDIE